MIYYTCEEMGRCDFRSFFVPQDLKIKIQGDDFPICSGEYDDIFRLTREETRGWRCNFKGFFVPQILVEGNFKCYNFHVVGGMSYRT